MKDKGPKSLEHHELLRAAMALAMQYHAGQVDKSGKPYVLHPIRVMAALGPNEDPDVQAAALCHDILEDTECPPEELLNTLSSPAFSMVVTLTRRKDEEYFDYICRVARDTMCNGGAKRIKLSDLRDNIRPERYVSGLNLYSRYFKALAILEGREVLPPSQSGPTG